MNHKREKPTISVKDFADVLEKKDLPKNWRKITASDFSCLWGQMPKGSLPKLEIFVRGMLMAPSRAEIDKTNGTMPLYATPAVLKLMTDFGVKEDEAATLYDLIRNQIHGKPIA
mgnify:CR=1 FL=1